MLFPKCDKVEICNRTKCLQLPAIYFAVAPYHQNILIRKKMIKELDPVVLSRDLPELGLKRGDIGAVVHCYKSGEAFEVEFITGEGETVAVVTLSSKDMRLMQDKEILHVRKLQAA